MANDECYCFAGVGPFGSAYFSGGGGYGYCGHDREFDFFVGYNGRNCASYCDGNADCTSCCTCCCGADGSTYTGVRGCKTTGTTTTTKKTTPATTTPNPEEQIGD